MYDSKFIKKTHYKRGEKIFPPPFLKSLKKKKANLWEKPQPEHNFQVMGNPRLQNL